MAFVIPTKRGRFEIRESHSTPAGPRSRTLASFKELDQAAVQKAQARAMKPVSEVDLRKAALRAGAPVASPEVDKAARETLRRLARGEQVDPMLRRFLLDALGTENRTAEAAELSDAARAATAWIGTEPAERGKTLRELLELADALPVRLRSSEIGFPRLSSAGSS